MPDEEHIEERNAWAERPPFFWIAAGLSLVVLALYVFVAGAYARYGKAIVDLDWNAAYERGAWRVTTVDPGGPAAGALQPGDTILGVASEASVAKPHQALAFEPLEPGAPYVLRIERGGETRELTLVAPERYDRHLLALNLSLLLVSASFFGLALLLGLRRPDLWIGRIGFVTFLGEAIGFASVSLDPIRPFFSGWEDSFDLVFLAVQPFQAALAYHFFRDFPRATPKHGAWRALTYVFYAAAVLFVVPNVLVIRAMFDPGEFRFGMLSESGGLMMAYFAAYRVFLVAGLVSSFAVLVRNYYCDQEAVERRRIRWVVIGLAASVLPFGLLQVSDFVAVSFGSRSIIANAENTGVLYFFTASFVLVPLTIGYAILKHRIFNIHVAVRLGVRYLLARGVLEALLTVPIAALVVEVVRHPDLTVGELFFENTTSVVLLGGVALSLSLRSRLGEWVDRAFFRAAYDRERILVRLAEEISGKDSLAEISRRVSAELEAALHPKRFVLLFRHQESPRLVVGYSNDERASEALVAEDNALLYAFAGEPGTVDVSRVRAHVPEREIELLDELGISTVVPLPGTEGQVAGLLMLGEKRSEEPYSARDRALLEAVAAQLAIVAENARLKTRVARDERIRLEVLGRMEREQINLLKECPVCGTCYDSVATHCAVEGAELTYTLPVERVVDGKYRLDHLIGRGGMGSVYEGTDLRLGRIVAVKVMTGRSFGDLEALRRFQREARASARLTHPNLVRVYDYGTLGDGGAYMVLELLRGRTLRQVFTEGGPLPPAEAAEVVGQIFDGIAAVHAAGIVHRDLKPENVMLVEEGGRRVAKILDFGLAKLRAADASDAVSITSPGTIMGTFGYMSPEQLSGGEVDERTDVFAVSVMLFEALAGRRPFEARRWGDLLAEISRGEIHLPGDAPEVRRLEALFARALAPDPADRFSTAAEARAALLPAVLALGPLGGAAAAASVDAAASDELPTLRGVDGAE